MSSKLSLGKKGSRKSIKRGTEQQITEKFKTQIDAAKVSFGIDSEKEFKRNEEQTGKLTTYFN